MPRMICEVLTAFTKVSPFWGKSLGRVGVPRGGRVPPNIAIVSTLLKSLVGRRPRKKIVKGRLVARNVQHLHRTKMMR